MGLYFHHRSSLEHDTGSHPENADRIRAIEHVLGEAGWPGLERIEAPLAEREWLERVHTPEHVSRVELACFEGDGTIDADTIVVAASWEAALRGAGAAADAAERLLAGEDRFAFCGMRPPGHHAESNRAMGFCLFNNAAVAASRAIAAAGAERVLILDWDVHHGNGTAEIFYDKDEVLFASIHQSPLYPGTGHPGEIGSGAGEGYTVNLPVAPGSGGAEFLALVQHVVAPIGRDFAPDLIIVSAGYDAHSDDPLAECELTTADYGELTAGVRDLGDELGSPVLVCLEGGYAVNALASSVLATVEALDDNQPAAAVDAAPAEPAREFFGQGRWSEALSR
jgi:acetoin utilization deacetylase AcuC-like enzyme